MARHEIDSDRLRRKLQVNGSSFPSVTVLVPWFSRRASYINHCMIAAHWESIADQNEQTGMSPDSQSASQSLPWTKHLLCYWDQTGQEVNAATKQGSPPDWSPIQIKFFRSSTGWADRPKDEWEMEEERQKGWMVMFVPLFGLYCRTVALHAHCKLRLTVVFFYLSTIRHAIRCQFIDPKNKCRFFKGGKQVNEEFESQKRILFIIELSWVNRELRLKWVMINLEFLNWSLLQLQ